MTNIAQSLTDLIGNTPLLELKRIQSEHEVQAQIIAKLEYFNPAGSVKDRVGLALIEDAEAKGLINKASVIIEPTSGNTGIGLALAAAVKGYRLILTMPENMSIERQKLLSALGAEIVLTPAALGIPGAIEKANELASIEANAFIPQQFNNPANPDIHRRTTAEEILKDTQGKLDYFVCGVGTGGTITGVSEVLKAYDPKIKIVAVEPSTSPVLSGGKAGVHNIQGIGTGFIPNVLNTDILDEIAAVAEDDALKMVRDLAKFEGLLVGISSGAALSAALEIAKKPANMNKRIVVLFPDSGERYLSMDIFNT